MPHGGTGRLDPNATMNCVPAQEGSASWAVIHCPAFEAGF